MVSSDISRPVIDKSQAECHGCSIKSRLFDFDSADIHGIKIKQSAFDGTTMTLSLTFINDRAADVTAYHYCSKLISTDPKQTREQCVLIDALTPVLEVQADKRARPGN